MGELSNVLQIGQEKEDSELLSHSAEAQKSDELESPDVSQNVTRQVKEECPTLPSNFSDFHMTDNEKSLNISQSFGLVFGQLKKEDVELQSNGSDISKTVYE